MKKIDKKQYKKTNKQKVKVRKKISILNILFLLLAFSLVTSLVFKNRENFKNIFTKKNKIKTPQASKANALEIGNIVYYDHKRAADSANKAKQSVTIPVGDSKTPGSGYGTADQTFNAKNYNTTWRVWDKLSDGRVMLVSNKTVARFYTKGAVGHIWWEHNAHKVSSILGYGEGADVGIKDTGEAIGANKSFLYKVGSGIDNAPDMTEGDKGNWKIGEEPKDKINISAARSLTLPEVEEKLGITPEKINDPSNGFITNKSNTNGGPYYGNQTTTSMNYVVQRDINSPKQNWENEEDRKKGKAKNNSYLMTDKKYWWEEVDIPETKYKDMLFNQINNWNGLATNALSVNHGGSNVIFDRGYVQAYHWGNRELGSQHYGLAHSHGIRWSEDYFEPTLRVVVYLKSNLDYYEAEGENEKVEVEGSTPNGEWGKIKVKAWDIYQPNSEDKNVKLKVLNLSSTSIDKIGIKASKVNTEGVLPEDITKEIKNSIKVNKKYEYNLNIKKYSGQKRDKNTTGDKATFSKMDNKYNVEITGIPSGYDFKILGKTGKQIDLDTDTNLEYELVIYPKAGKLVIPVEYIGGENYDEGFGVHGDVLIKSGDEIIGRKWSVYLKRGINSVEIENVNLFDEKTNTLKNYTVEFKRDSGDTTSHIIKYDDKNKKIVITFVPFDKQINISVSEDSKKYLTNITEIKLKLVGGEEKNITLKPTDFTTKLIVPERDKSGNVINYSLQKVENVPGYYLSIDGFNVNLKPILKLPFTGTELSGKNIVIISLGLFGIALAFRFRKKLVLIFKEYTMMK